MVIKRKLLKDWLSSMSRTELAMVYIEQAIKDLELKLENPPSYLITGIGKYGESGADGVAASKGESYSAWMEEAKSRLKKQNETLAEHRKKVYRYREAMEALGRECGDLAVRIIEAKYYRHIKPDETIYELIVYCTRESFYRKLNIALEFFCDVLPDDFLDVGNKRKAAG